MLYLFRNIRQELLNTSPVKQYFLYAFGKLLIVVGGIIIALSPSKWDQSRLEKDKALNLTQSMLTELNADVEIISNFLAIQRQEKLLDVRDRFLQESSSQILKNYASNEFKATYIALDSLTQTTYQTITSVGKTGYVDVIDLSPKLDPTLHPA